MNWYFEDLPRNRHERLSLDSLAARVDWLVPHSWRVDSSLRLIWDADIVIDDRVFEFSLRYPNHFPFSPPIVLPRNDASRWSIHQYGAGGELCLEIGPDNWNRDITGAQMVESAHRLLRGETPVGGVKGAVPSRHQTTPGQNLRGKIQRFFITRNLEAFCQTLNPGVGRMTQGTMLFHDDSLVHFIRLISSPDGGIWSDDSVPKPLEMEGFSRDMLLFTWEEGHLLPRTNSLEEFKADLAEKGIFCGEASYAIVFQGNSFSAYRIGDADLTPIVVIVEERVSRRLDPAHAALSSKKVGLVGCGSLGSKIAASLARSGVGKFLLIDDDVLFPDNLVRHELDWRDVATHKADSVARRIQLIQPRAICERRRDRFGGQESSGSVETLIEAIADCDLIIDATADPAVFNYLCAAVAHGKKPLIWAEVFGGGVGGFIARHRPTIEPEPALMRRTIENWCGDQGHPIVRSAKGYEGNQGELPQIADDGDVSVIASHAARFAIDLLIPRHPSLFPDSVYMIGLSGEWFFDQPFDTRPIDVGIAPPEEITEPIDKNLALEEIPRIINLLLKVTDGNSAA